jgi:hypothetical protein
MNALHVTLAASVLLAAGMGSVRADLLAYEGFDYGTEGTLFGAGTGTGWGGDDVHVDQSVVRCD